MFSFKITPRNDVFFGLLEQATAQAVEAATQLYNMVTDFTDVETKLHNLAETEKKADSINHEITRVLSKTFVTPFDREDLHRLAYSIDDIVDHTEAAGTIIVLCRVQQTTPYVIKMVSILMSATTKLNSLITNLRNMKDGRQQYIDIHELENQGDVLWQQAFASLFDGSCQPMDAMKWKEIYEQCEKAIDSVERVAEIIEEVIQKNG